MDFVMKIFEGATKKLFVLVSKNFGAIKVWRQKICGKFNALSLPKLNPSELFCT